MIQRTNDEKFFTWCQDQQQLLVEHNDRQVIAFVFSQFNVDADSAIHTEASNQGLGAVLVHTKTE